MNQDKQKTIYLFDLTVKGIVDAETEAQAREILSETFETTEQVYVDELCDICLWDISRQNEELKPQ